MYQPSRSSVLETNNERALLASTMGATQLSLLLVLAALLPGTSAAGDAHPGYADDGSCGMLDDGAGAADALLLEERGSWRRRVVDITHAYVPDMPAFVTGDVIGPVLRLRESMENGSEYNLSELHMSCHVGTHAGAHEPGPLRCRPGRRQARPPSPQRYMIFSSSFSYLG
jgi:hypothetical protein